MTPTDEERQQFREKARRIESVQSLWERLSAASSLQQAFRPLRFSRMADEN